MEQRGTIFVYVSIRSTGRKPSCHSPVCGRNPACRPGAFSDLPAEPASVPPAAVFLSVVHSNPRNWQRSLPEQNGWTHSVHPPDLAGMLPDVSGPESVTSSARRAALDRLRSQAARSVPHHSPSLPRTLQGALEFVRW